MRKSVMNERTLEEILNSDDELTTDINEPSFVPAYQDDSRFEYLENKKESKIPLKESKIPMKESKIPLKESKIPLKEPFGNLNKGIFNKNDAFCIQSIQNIPNDTLLWFFKYLLLKDIQSNYTFLKSCLVARYEYNFSKETSMSCSSKETYGSYKVNVNKISDIL